MSQVSLSCRQASSAAARLSDLLLEMFNQNQKPKLSCHDVLTPEELGCRSRIVQSYVANHGRIKKEKKNRNIFVTVCCITMSYCRDGGRQNSYQSVDRPR